MKRKYILSAGAIGIIFMMLGQLSFSINDTLIKEIVIDNKNNLSIINILFLRGILTTSFIFLYLKFYEKKNILNVFKIKKYHLRGIYEVLTAVCFFTGLILLPVAEVYTLLMTNPFFVTIFAFIFLKEKVGIRRWLGIAVGFLGVYIVLDPNFEDFNYMKLAPVACSLCYAISMTITKYTSEKDNVYTQMSHLYIGAIIISILFYVFAGKGQFNVFSDPTFQFIFREWFSNPSFAWPFIIGMGFVGAFSFYCVFSAYSVASPSVVSLFEYSLIIWAIIIGYILFDNIPTLRTFVGVTLIIGAGIYIYIREKVRDQMIVTDTPNR